MKSLMLKLETTPREVQGVIEATEPDHVIMAMPRRAALTRMLQRHRKNVERRAQMKHVVIEGGCFFAFLFCVCVVLFILQPVACWRVGPVGPWPHKH